MCSSKRFRVRRALAVDPRYKRYVFEALKVKNMTRKARAKQDAPGHWRKNGARAKAGLNKAILASTWGQTKVLAQYQARRQGKLVIDVPAFYSSQECAACGHIHKDNRISQSELVCQRCAHTDYNAGKNHCHAWRQAITSWEVFKKEAKRCGILKCKVGAEGPEPIAVMQSLLRETEGSGLGGNTAAFWSLHRETPATAPALGA